VEFFDGEPSPGAGYEKAFGIDIPTLDGIPHRIVVRARGRRRPWDRVSIVLEEIRDDVHGHLMQYDDAHGRFHRHEPGWPMAGEIAEYLDAVAANYRAPYATSEIRTSYLLWERAVF
jgi:hypothetical protein